MLICVIAMERVKFNVADYRYVTEYHFVSRRSESIYLEFNYNMTNIVLCMISPTYPNYDRGLIDGVVLTK